MSQKSDSNMTVTTVAVYRLQNMNFEAHILQTAVLSLHFIIVSSIKESTLNCSKQKIDMVNSEKEGCSFNKKKTFLMWWYAKKEEDSFSVTT